MYRKVFPSELACVFFYVLCLSLSFPKAFVKKPAATWPKGLVFLASWFCLALADKAARDHSMIIREIQITIWCH